MSRRIASIAVAFGILTTLIPAQINGVTLNAVVETVYFKDVAGTVRGVLLLDVTNANAGALSGSVTLSAAGTNVVTAVSLLPGTHDVVVHAPQLWPQPPDASAQLILTVGGQSASLGPFTVGIHRPWTLHLAMDKHLDYVWQQNSEQATRDAMEGLADLFLGAIETEKAAGLAGHDEQSHFTFDTTIWWDAWAIERPGQVGRLVAAESTDHLEVGALYAVLLNGCLGTEEMIRALYPARSLQRDFGIDLTSAVPMESASVPWGLATVCAQAQIPFLVKGICGCAGQVSGGHLLYPASLFEWVGPDGSSVRLRWDSYSGNNQYWGGYAELYRLWVDGNSAGGITPAQEQDILATIGRFESYGAAFPLDQILLYGLGWDYWNIGPARITSMIQAWNAAVAAQGFDYPRLRNSTASEYAFAAEASLVQHGTSLPAYSGCFGADWEVWMLCHAGTYARARRAREALVSTETLAAVASLFDPTAAPAQQALLSDAWKKLILIVEHTAGSINTAGTGLDAGPVGVLKKNLVSGAETQLTTVRGQALATLGAAVRTGDQLEGETLLVVNPTQYDRDEVVEVEVAAGGPFTVTDPMSGAILPSQVVGAATPFRLRFVAPALPGVGYRSFRVASGGTPSGPLPVQADPVAGTLENQLYRVTVSPATGAIVSLIDKAHANRELVSATSGAPGANAFRAKGVFPGSATIQAVEVGPVSGSLVVSTAAQGRSCTTTITLHDGIDRVEIVNEVVRPMGSDPTDEVVFTFPWSLGAVQHRYEAGASITRPGYATQNPPGDHLPGSLQGYFAYQRWIDTAGVDGGGQPAGIRLAGPDSYMFSLGTSTQWNNPKVASPRVNLIAYDHAPPNGNIAVDDQSGENAMRFCFAIQGYDGAFDGAATAGFALSAVRSPEVLLLPAHQPGPLPADGHAFLATSDDDALMTAFKIAEEGLAQGYVARFWDAGTSGVSSSLAAGSFEAGAARALDLLERNSGPPASVAGSVPVSVGARSFQTLRILGGVANTPPTAVPPTPQSVVAGAVITLDGSGSVDPDDVPAFRWFQIGGKRVVLNGATTPTASFLAPMTGSAAEASLVFQLIVDDGKHLPATAVATVTVVTDATPPTAPAGLGAVATGQVIDLSWTAAMDPETGILGYNLYRADGGGSLALLTSLPGSATSWSDDLLLPGVTYAYQIHAVNGAGAQGPGSNVAMATTSDAPPPPPPGLAAVVGVQSVQLTWDAVMPPDVVGYRVYRAAVSGGPYALLADVGMNLSHVDSGLPLGATRFYVVRAYDAIQESADSVEVSATLENLPPPAPATLTAAARSQAVALEWSPVSDLDLVGYRISRRPTGGPSFAVIAIVDGVKPVYIDYSAVNGTAYDYVVRAFDTAQEGAPSPTAQATPSATGAARSVVGQDGLDATSVLNVVRVSGYSPSDRSDYVSNDFEIESAGMIFHLDVPRGALITSATLGVTAGPVQNPDPSGAMEIHVYDVAQAQPFVDGQPIDLLAHHPVWSTTVSWAAGTAWPTGSLHFTSSLLPLVQHLVDRPDWNIGNRIGFVITEGSLAAGRYYGWRDSSSGSGAPELRVTWTADAAPAPVLTLTPLPLGKTGEATLSGGPGGSPFGILASLLPDHVVVPSVGNVLIDLNFAVPLAVGTLSPQGTGTAFLPVPNFPGVSGLALYLQGYAGLPAEVRLTNLAVAVFGN